MRHSFVRHPDFFIRHVLPLVAVASMHAQIPAPPAPLREFRGAWLATVRGIDFPAEPGAPTEKPQAELRGIIEKAASLKINALIFQVRPMGDAFYKSDIEPWSPWLTGKMGKAPSPLWDPLEFAIKEAHARGIELHAWFNPFRALNGNKYAPGGNHVSIQHPDWVRRYDQDLWMDPGMAAVRERAMQVFMDVVKRYDVDGVHIDDYFYPYPVKKKGAAGYIEFDDEKSYRAYQAGGGKLERKAWRRENVDTLVRDIYESIKKVKPAVRFGISPFGLWRPGFPEGTGKGALDPYEMIAADSLKWLQNGWCDYLAPQLYWPIKPANLSYTSLFDWWLTQNTSRRHIWPGMASQKVLVDRQPAEILREISVTRERGQVMPPGHIHWNITALMKNQGTLATLVKERAYQDFAIPPSASWLGADVPPRPVVQGGGGKLRWQHQDVRFDSMTKWWLLQTYDGQAWKTARLYPVDANSCDLAKDVKAAAIRAVSFTGLASEAAVTNVK